MTDKRTERDSMGEILVDRYALYGAQTQRAIDNFPVSGRTMPELFIRSLLMIKSAAAKTNAELGQITPAMGDAIQQAAELLLLDPDLMKHFPVDVYQTGSGTSTNMNANEVLATLATRLGNEQEVGTVGANDHINYGQSSNDVIPSAIHVSASLALEQNLIPALEYLESQIRKKSLAVNQYVKTGRTHLMDAMPVRLSQSLDAWADQIQLNTTRLKALQSDIQSLALGGTAVGTGINAHPEFATLFSRNLSALTGLDFSPAGNFFTHIGSQDCAVALSGQLKTCAVTLMKVSNDLRWMNSGPLAGLGEIELQALQPGSSIMPGKVNPVIPESAAMVCAQVIGNDVAITVAGQSGSFELNVMLPLVANNLLDSLQNLSNVSRLLADKAIATFRVNETRLQEALSKNPILVTALNPVIGYEKAAAVAKKAYAEGRAIIDVACEETELSRDELSVLLDPVRLTEGGIQSL